MKCSKNNIPENIDEECTCDCDIRKDFKVAKKLFGYLFPTALIVVGLCSDFNYLLAGFSLMFIMYKIDDLCDKNDELATKIKNSKPWYY